MHEKGAALTAPNQKLQVECNRALENRQQLETQLEEYDRLSIEVNRMEKDRKALREKIIEGCGRKSCRIAHYTITKTERKTYDYKALAKDADLNIECYVKSITSTFTLRRG